MSTYLFLCIVNALVGFIIIFVKLVRDEMYPGLLRTIGCLLYAFVPMVLSCLLFNSVVGHGHNIPNLQLEFAGGAMVFAVIIVSVPAAIMEFKEKK